MGYQNNHRPNGLEDLLVDILFDIDDIFEDINNDVNKIQLSKDLTFISKSVKKALRYTRKQNNIKRRAK